MATLQFIHRSQSSAGANGTGNQCPRTGKATPELHAFDLRYLGRHRVLTCWPKRLAVCHGLGGVSAVAGYKVGRIRRAPDGRGRAVALSRVFFESRTGRCVQSRRCSKQTLSQPCLSVTADLPPADRRKLREAKGKPRRRPGKRWPRVSSTALLQRDRNAL